MLDAIDVLAAEKIDYAVIGAMAASVHGAVRASIDADAVISVAIARLRDLERKFAHAGFRAQLTHGDPDDPISALLALTDEHGNRVDLLVGLRGLDPETFSRSVRVPFQGAVLRVVGLEDFIAMKVFAGGPVDISDARNALAVSRNLLDLVLLRRLAQRFGRNTGESLEALLHEPVG